jgi:voltage-gated potassium channel
MATTKLRRRHTRFKRFVRDVTLHTPVTQMISLLVTLWVMFAAVIYACEQGAEDTSILSLGDALYWGIAAFSTAGIADTPQSGFGKAFGGIWIIVGSIIFFGTIVSTITMYFMRPLQRPLRRIVDTIEYNLEQLDQLSIDELKLLKDTTDTLIAHVERLRAQREQATEGPSP